MSKELAKQYAPQEVEQDIYDFWLKGKYFHAEPDPEKVPFTVVIPPPNVTGQLHMGHALDETLQDILIRYKRMQGFNALWVPGTDHAGIATQIKVEEELRKTEGLTRHDLGREEFLKRVWAWKEQYGNRIINQLKKLGSSCDWDRERFTMDEGCSKAVKEVFINLYNKGLIYKGNRIINWCPNCITALSDAEVEYDEQQGNFWHIRYPVKDSDEFVEIATTRPETMLGDTAVAVHPEDERYTHLVGKTLVLPLVGREIPVIADEYVEKDFGTGCVKITPSHDPNDFEVGKRHNLEEILVLDDKACVNENGGKYQGMDRYEARKAIVADLEAGGWLVKIKPHMHNVGTCYRCGTTVEPLTSDQWFVKMKPLVEPAIKAVEDGSVSFVPERFSKNYFNWMNNILDWCISRQLWWGHRIPAFFCDACGNMEVSKEDVTVCSRCGAPTRQEEDVLDTWFSSALWPFSTLGWPDKTEDLARYYPTDTLVTGYDIITFWVSRMIFSGLEHMGEKPFSKVFIHGLVRDAQGRKMSKSLGNGIDPLKIIEQYGADALRFALVTGNSPGNDMRFSDEKIEAARNFANKLWNASRFVLMNLSESDGELLMPFAESDLAIEDKWILTRYNELVGTVNANLGNYELGIALGEIYSFTWDSFCDRYIEMVKSRIFDTGSLSALTAKRVLVKVLTGILKLLHPYMPFITEEIYQSIPHSDESIMISEFPKSDEALVYKTEESDVDMIIECITAIRARRAEMNVPPSKKARLIVVTKHKDTFSRTAKILEKLASASEVVIADGYDSDDAVMIATGAGNLYIPLAEVVDLERERERLCAEMKKNDSEIERLEKKLANDGFVAKAPAAVIEGERAKLAKYLETRESLKTALARLG